MAELSRFESLSHCGSSGKISGVGLELLPHSQVQ
jgi:hypothetical protein